MFSYIENIYHTIIKKYMELTNCLEKRRLIFKLWPFFYYYTMSTIAGFNLPYFSATKSISFLLTKKENTRNEEL